MQTNSFGISFLWLSLKNKVIVLVWNLGFHYFQMHIRHIKCFGKEADDAGIWRCMMVLDIVLKCQGRGVPLAPDNSFLAKHPEATSVSELRTYSLVSVLQLGTMNYSKGGFENRIVRSGVWDLSYHVETDIYFFPLPTSLDIITIGGKFTVDPSKCNTREHS